MSRQYWIPLKLNKLRISAWNIEQTRSSPEGDRIYSIQFAYTLAFLLTVVEIPCLSGNLINFSLHNHSYFNNFTLEL